MRYPLLAVALLASASAFAGGPGCDHGGKQADRIARITEELNLDATQASQVEQILKSQHERMRAEHDAIHADTLTQLRTVLTEEQVQALEESWSKHGRHRGPRAGEEIAEAGA